MRAAYRSTVASLIGATDRSTIALSRAEATRTAGLMKALWKESCSGRWDPVRRVLVAATVGSVAGTGLGADEQIGEVVARIDDAVARRLLASAAAGHDDVMRAVRLAAAVSATQASSTTRASSTPTAPTPEASDAEPVTVELTDAISDELTQVRIHLADGVLLAL